MLEVIDGSYRVPAIVCGIVAADRATTEVKTPNFYVVLLPPDLTITLVNAPCLCMSFCFTLIDHGRESPLFVCCIVLLPPIERSPLQLVRITSHFPFVFLLEHIVRITYCVLLYVVFLLK